MSCASPRPATIRINVATMGCMPAFTTSNPFHSPHSAAAPSAAPMAANNGSRLSLAPPTCMRVMVHAATVAAIASTAPTEMSRPRTAITIVMPSDTSASGAARLAMSTRLPNRCPSRHCRARKPGLNSPLPASSSASAASGQNSGWETRRRIRHCPRSVRAPAGHRCRPAVHRPCAGRAARRCDRSGASVRRAPRRSAAPPCLAARAAGSPA